MSEPLKRDFFSSSVVFSNLWLWSEFSLSWMQWRRHTMWYRNETTEHTTLWSSGVSTMDHWSMGAGKTEFAYHILFFVKNIKLNVRGIEGNLPNRRLLTNCWKIEEMVLETTKGRGNLPFLYIFPSRPNKIRVEFSLLTYSRKQWKAIYYHRNRSRWWYRVQFLLDDLIKYFG